MEAANPLQILDRLRISAEKKRSAKCDEGEAGVEKGISEHQASHSLAALEYPCHTARLPLWPEATRGVPNAVLRSALFGAIRKGRRAFQQRVQKATVDGVKMIHTGPTLDQADLDVWEQCLQLARESGLGARIEFTAHAFLKAIGRSTGRSQHEWLKGERLPAWPRPWWR